MIEIRQASKTLDSLGIAAIDVLKIDTEGCELPILADRASVIPAIKLIDLEFHSEHDRFRIDDLLSTTRILAFATVRHPHRGDLCYVHRDTPFARRYEALAIRGEI